MTDTIDVAYEFPYNPQLPADIIEIPKSFTVGEFKNRIKSKWNFDISDYYAIYNSEVQADTKKFSDFWSADSEPEILFVKESFPINRMTDTIDVDSELSDDAQHDEEITEIPRSFTVGEFKDSIKPKLEIPHFNVSHIIYNAAIRSNTKKFLDFWPDYLVKDSFITNSMTDIIDVDYIFSHEPELGADVVEIPRSFTVGELKNKLKPKYKNLDFNDYTVIYNSAIQSNNKKFSDFWSEDPLYEILFVRESFPLNQMPDTIDVDYEFSDEPQLGGDTVEIPRSFTVGDFKEKIKSKYYHLDFNEYHVIYMKNSALLPNSKKFSDFWCDDPVSEIRFVKDSNSACIKFLCWNNGKENFYDL